jgi:hypothetical protein
MAHQLPKLYFGMIIAYDRETGDLNVALVSCATAYRTRKAACKDLFAQRYNVLDPEEYEKHELWEVDCYNINEVRYAFGSDLNGGDDDDDSRDGDQPTSPDPEDHGVTADVFEREMVEIPASGDVRWRK